MEKMTSSLPPVDLQKLRRLLAVKEAYNAGKLSLDEARKALREEVGPIKPYEIALAEQELNTFDPEECRKEDIQQMLNLFDGLIDTTRPVLPHDHPIACYYRENDELRKILLAIDDLVQYPVIKNQWLEIYDRLKDYRIHLQRKQNQLYPVLEQKGFDRPTTTMWQLDDFIRDEISQARRLIEADDDDRFIALQPTLTADIRDLMQKEETVLYPTSLAMITPAEFDHMKGGDREIGFAWIAAPGESTPHPAATPPAATPPEGLAAELTALLGKYGYGANAGAAFDVATGRLTLEQINLIYRHMPVDLSFVDENERVCFYTDTPHRVFPRSRNVIGRDVKNCHPRTSVHIVEEIIDKFRSGEQDHAEFWINKPGLFIYITYKAVRDAEGRFRGVLEMMQDCTRIRSLEGSRTLLTWDSEQAPSADTPAEAPAADTARGDESPAGGHDDLNAPAAPRAQADAPADESPTPEITAETRLPDLFDRYPHLKGRMSELSPRFRMLTSPLARVMLPKATVGTASERSGVPLDALIAGIRRLIDEMDAKG